MNPNTRLPVWVAIASILTSLCVPFDLLAQPSSKTEPPFVPDPVAVTRYKSGWRYPQSGWNVVHIEGSPYDRGYQHGRLLAREIVDYCQIIGKYRNYEAPDKAWRDLRLFVNALFMRKFDAEYLREMQGIADGAASVGAKLDGRLLDLIDIVVINTDVEVGFLESALEGTATGIDSEQFQGRHGSPMRAHRSERCSAFVATGPATANGQIVAGHITMSDLAYVPFFNVWLDIQPSTGHRMVFQTFPGGIQSGLDYYITDAGLIVSETTIEQTKFNPQAETLASRIRRALQYSDSIDRCVEVLTSSSNGLYTNQWLFGDIKSNEIAMFELGTDKSRLWRSSRNEWLGGAKGFYWGCNNVKDTSVFKESVADLRAKPKNLVLHPKSRDAAWLKLYAKNQGKIDEGFGFEAFSTAPIVGFPSCDAKFTTAALAKDLKSWLFFGPPLGRTWTPSEDDEEIVPSVEPFVSHDWTLVDVKGVNLPAIRSDSEKRTEPADAEVFPKKGDSLQLDAKTQHPFAWRGTVLPKGDADIWLAAAFAEYEHVVALEHAVEFHHDNPSDHSSKTKTAKDDEKSVPDKDDSMQAGQDLVDLALFQHESNWLTAIRRTGDDIPFAKTKSDLADSDWYRIASGKGVMLLAALRKTLGSTAFIKLMDEFGQANAGNEVTTEQFRSHVKATAGEAAVKTLDRWLNESVAADFDGRNPWTIFSHEVEPHRVLIVYGTLHDQAAQKEAARHLQTEVVRRFANVWPPVKSDQEVTDDDLKSHYLLLVGRPYSNRVSGLCHNKSKSFPVKFDQQSFSVANETYAHPETWIVAAGENPFNRRYSVVIFAGLNASSTWRSVRNLPDSDDPNPQVMLDVAGKRTRKFRVQETK